MTGAITPANRESAADVPHAVPRILVPNVSGVMPSVVRCGFGVLTQHSVHCRPGQRDEHGRYRRRETSADVDKGEDGYRSREGTQSKRLASS